MEGDCKGQKNNGVTGVVLICGSAVNKAANNPIVLNTLGY